ncbi:MAG: putative aminopeptidase YsdC [Tenericutes bacterium ADurb.Bin087]|nr:MAG: putative aminopeptidase YsdC [Tenericutes bacterium ADurb.Bin087]
MLTKRELKLLEKVTQIDAIPGYEHELARFVKAELEKYGFTIVSDNLGSVFGVKKSVAQNAPRIMVGGHLDEVGFTVREVNEKGFIRVDARGGVNANTLLASRVRLTLDDGTKLIGSVGATAPHYGGEGNPTLDTLDFDFGFISKEDAAKRGVRVGQMIVADGPFTVLNDGKRLLAKAFDNRYGVFMALEMARHFANIDLPYDLYIGATVQEEVGLRGATTISNVINPDLAIVLDCSPARDNISSSEQGQLGDGILIRYLDRSMIAFPELLTFQEKSAEAVKVPYQYFHSPGGTDAGAIHLHAAGVLTLTHCICARSIHTAASIVDTSDIKNAKKVLIRMLKTLNRDKINKFKAARR